MSRIELVQEFLTKNLGWKIDIDAKTFEKKMSRICKELDYETIDSCINSLQHSKGDAKIIKAYASEFSVSETYFFRDLNFFNHLEHTIIPQIIQKNRRSLSILSIGCSSGEELYSIAILLRKMIPDIDNWNLHLLGIDVNPLSLEKAKQGIYTQYSFRQTPQQYMNYFKHQGLTYEVAPQIKKMVEFKYHNILEGPYNNLPYGVSEFDLIIIKNVLIYFEPHKAKMVVDSIFASLKDGGWLITTAVEFSMDLFNFPYSQCSSNNYCMQKVLKKNTELTLIALKNEPIKPIPNIINEIVDELVQLVPEPKKEQILLDTHDKSLYYTNALGMLKIANEKEAKILLRQALYLDKNFVMAHVLLGNILRKEGNFEPSLKHIRNAKESLEQMNPQQEVELSGGMMANDLLGMINAIGGKKFE